MGISYLMPIFYGCNRYIYGYYSNLNITLQHAYSMQTIQSAKSKQKAHQLIKKGKLNEAILLINKIIHDTPQDPELLFILGSCYANLNQFEKTILALKKCIEMQPGAVQALFLLGTVYSVTGEQEKAVSYYEKTIAFGNNTAEANASKGRVYLAQGLFKQAEKELNIAIKKQPHLIDPYLCLVSIYQQTSDYQYALNGLKKALLHEPKNPRILTATAMCLVNLLQKDEATIYFKRALRINPDDIDATCGLVRILNIKGKYNESLKLITPLISKDTLISSSLATSYLECCRINKSCDKALHYAEKVIAQATLSKLQAKNLHFAVAKILDRRNDYDNAFYHYKKANDSIKDTYDSVTHTKKIDDTINTFSVGTMMSLPRSNNTNRPIFIVGMPRSGTSLTEQILAAHPDVYAAGELDDLGLIINKFLTHSNPNTSYSDHIKSLSAETINNMAQQYLDKLDGLSKSATHFTDKMPHNFYLLGYIQLLFPNARIIHCRRNPLDTCLSIYFQNFAAQHAYAKNLFDIGTHYYQYNRLMKHWENILTMPIFEMEYEELVSNQEKVTRELLEFCDLEWNDKCLEFHKVKRTVDTASHDQVRQKLYNKSINRWKNYEQYLDDLKEGLNRAY